MKNRWFLLICLLLLTHIANAAKYNLDSLYQCLDEAILQSPRYVAVREGRIAKLASQLNACKNDGARYQMSFALFQEYRAYKNDSAVSYLNRCIALAERMGDQAKKGNAISQLAFQCSTIGDYVESYSLLNKIDTTKLDAEGYRNYLWAGQHLYAELTYYSNVPSLKEHYAQKAQVMKKQIARIFSHTDDRYLQMMEEDCRSANDLKGALYYSNLRMKQVKPGTHEYAIVAYYRAVICKYFNKDDAIYYFLTSALCDVRTAVMDQGSMLGTCQSSESKPKGVCPYLCLHQVCMGCSPHFQYRFAKSPNHAVALCC